MLHVFHQVIGVDDNNLAAMKETYCIYFQQSTQKLYATMARAKENSIYLFRIIIFPIFSSLSTIIFLSIL